jgi:EpsI family protein
MKLPLQNWVGACLMAGAAVAGHALTPSVYAAQRNHIDLEAMVPKHFGAWRQDDESNAVVQSPEMEARLMVFYSQVLMRDYQGADGTRVMLAVAYTTDQRGNSGHHVHLPEVCYPAQGFSLRDREQNSVRVAGHLIPVVRMVATQGARIEPLMYWITLDGMPENAYLRLKLDQIRASLLHGLVQDGMIFRVSVIDPDPVHAYQVESQFLNDLFNGVDAHARQAIFGVAS